MRCLCLPCRVLSRRAPQAPAHSRLNRTAYETMRHCDGTKKARTTASGRACSEKPRLFRTVPPAWWTMRPYTRRLAATVRGNIRTRDGTPRRTRTIAHTPPRAPRRRYARPAARSRQAASMRSFLRVSRDARPSHAPERLAEPRAADRTARPRSVLRGEPLRGAPT